MYIYEKPKAANSKRVWKTIPVSRRSDARLISNPSYCGQSIMQMKSAEYNNGVLHDRPSERTNFRISPNSTCIQCNGHKGEFQGTEAVPVELINEKRVIALLKAHSRGKGRSKSRADKIIENGFEIRAGIHRGGTGGAAGGADPRPHITILSNKTVYHLHLNNDESYITDITP